MAESSSRLQRLLTLLDTASTQATRFAAARQIGEIAQSHPRELNALLKKVSHYLRSRNWDTRVAAAHAVGAIAQNVKHTSVKELLKLVEDETIASGFADLANDVGSVLSVVDPTCGTGFTFGSFDINNVLAYGSPLLASGGQEYDLADNIKDPAERLARQKHNLRQRLGLDVSGHFMDVNDIIKDEDLLVDKSQGGMPWGRNGIYSFQHSQNNQQLVTTMLPSYRQRSLSARQLNMLKRKAKSNAKDHTRSLNENNEDDVPKSSQSNGVCSGPVGSSKETNVFADEENLEYDESGRWPFQQYVEHLIHDMFDPIWEVRHGTVMALREILTHQGSSAGVYFPDLSVDIEFADFDAKRIIEFMTRSQNIDLNEEVALEEYQPLLKRQKVDASSNHSQSVDSSNGNDPINGTYLSTDMVSSEVLAQSCKAEPESCHADHVSDSICSDAQDAYKSKETQLSTVSGESSASRWSSLSKLPHDSRLMKLLKLAKHSWIKNWDFLQDCAIRLICVLALDRFGDYVSDQVVAPVRETCAQALGALLKFMHPSLVHGTLNILLRMQWRQEWEVRHGSLLGIKYLVAVRQELLPNLLADVLPLCKNGLEDPADDVRAVAAEALVPTASSLVTLDDQMLQSIVLLLWDILLELDDLSPSTSSVMNLLAELYSQAEMVPKILDALTSMEKDQFDLNKLTQVTYHPDISRYRENPYVLANLTPRLWPFMRHSITSVRHSAVRTLERLLEVTHAAETAPSKYWASSILDETLRIVYQNLLLESNEEILLSSERVWRLLIQYPEMKLESAARLYFSSWLQLAVTSYGSSFDSTKMYMPVALPRRGRPRTSSMIRTVNMEHESRMISFDFVDPSERSFDISSTTAKIVAGSDSDRSVTHMRVLTATALGCYAAKLPESSWQVIVDSLWSNLTSFSGVPRQVASMVIAAWCKELRSIDVVKSTTLLSLMAHVKQWLLDLLGCTDPALPTKDSLLPYSELGRTYAKMRSEARQLFHTAESCSCFTEYLSTCNINMESLGVDEAIGFASKLLVPTDSDVSIIEKGILTETETSKQRLLSTSGYLKCIQSNLHVTVLALVASAVVWMSDLPSKLNPLILPLMSAIKREQEEILQDRAAEALAELILYCVGRRPSPNDKLIKNLCSLTCADTAETPQVVVINSMEVIQDQNLLSFVKPSTARRSRASVAAGVDDRFKSEGFISRRGSEMTLKHVCEKFESSLFEKLPKLWDCLTEFLKPVPAEMDQLLKDDQHILELSKACEEHDPQSLINNIQVVRSTSPLLAHSLRPQLLTLLPCILGCVRHSHVAVRLAAARCIMSMVKVLPANVMCVVLENVIPMLSDSLSVNARQGAGMLVCLLVQGLGMELVPYAPLLVVPLLKCMSDTDIAVRQSVTRSFAALVPLLPLAKGASLPNGLTDRLSSSVDDVQFLEQLLDNSRIDDYKLNVDLKVGLRRYQQEGINWLAFLRRFKLHGILCDDMGLGKTLQASAIVATDIAEWRAHNKNKEPLSLIVCPTTLVGHWAYEVEKYIDESILSTLQYVGSYPDRLLLRNQFDTCNAIITSYDVLRKDIDFLAEIPWNYCILDEGHIIKNSRSRITSAVKQLKAQHRLILSGTPIQNNVLELWSLFDFLMPGFLGSEKQFHNTYGKPLLAAKDAKCTAKDAEAGILAMEALHKQVMPFLLRRTKDEVLSDLPEKIIQDRYCDLSLLQVKLYEKFSCSSAKEEVSSAVKQHEATEDSTAPKATRHVFQALQYLLKLCSHPLLVIGDKPSDYLGDLLRDVGGDGGDIYTEIHQLHHSPKLIALQEILQECGIGLDAASPGDNVTVGQHRVLIFAQHKAFLDIIEKDLFASHMKSVTYLRIDGSVDADKRFDIVKAFNSDPTIDVLLLTTHVGGLGLNLTSADTLVFMEHDWNPMKDHQAMDRAHRLGQRKVVNVHRLIMRGTLEEKVMSLQRFKLSVANSVINAENASLKTMNTDQLLDLFTTAPSSRKGSGFANSESRGSSKGKPGGKGLKAMLNGLEELWDQSQYADELDLNQFLAKLNR